MGKSKNNNDPFQCEQWTIKQLKQKYRDPHLLIIDLRNGGIFRGGPPENPKEIPSDYHQGHLFLALNLNLTQLKEHEDIQQEILTGANSAGGSFLDTLVLAITSGFHFLFYTQDGEGVEILEMLKRVSIFYHDEDYCFPENRLHWLAGGYRAIQKSSLCKYCADTKTLLGYEEEIEEPEYSEVLPFLFVGGAVCSEGMFFALRRQHLICVTSVPYLVSMNSLAQYQELKDRGVKKIVNVSNVERSPQGFECTFIYADDDQVEQLSRVFEQVAELIETAEKSGEAVYVHCQRGLSRSPSLVMAYLMLKKGYDLRGAYEYVKEKRANIGPRSNFIAQLCLLEKRLAEQGVLTVKSNSAAQLKYSLPIQVYELSSMRCANYEESMEFLFKPDRKRSRMCTTVLQKYRDLKVSL